MYYHSQPMKHVVYGKIGGNPEPNDWFGPAYRWLGQHCGFFPQVWLSRGSCQITGIRRRPWKLPRREVRRAKNRENVLFGFDTIVGFPVRYDAWYMITSTADLFEARFGRIADKASARRFEEWLWAEYRKSDAADAAECPEDKAWLVTYNFASVDDWLARDLFVERDQVVVPSLNLKAAKKIVCRDERQKKVLRRLGFIEDRIEIRNFAK